MIHLKNDVIPKLGENSGLHIVVSHSNKVHFVTSGRNNLLSCARSRVNSKTNLISEYMCKNELSTEVVL